MQSGEDVVVRAHVGTLAEPVTVVRCHHGRRLTGDTLVVMPEVTIRELRNRGGDVVDAVAGGSTVTVTRDGRPVAELRPLSRTPLSAAALVERARHLPVVDAAAWRADVDDVLDTRL